MLTLLSNIADSLDTACLISPSLSISFTISRNSCRARNVRTGFYTTRRMRSRPSSLVRIVVEFIWPWGISRRDSFVMLRKMRTASMKYCFDSYSLTIGSSLPIKKSSAPLHSYRHFFWHSPLHTGYLVSRQYFSQVALHITHHPSFPAETPFSFSMSGLVDDL